MPDPTIIIAGPTASGKTGLSIELARVLGGEIVSADSRMVYRGLDIGTGKPTWEHRQLPHSPWIKPARREAWGPARNASHSDAGGPVYAIAGIDHHLLDVVEPETRFALTDWLAHARAAIVTIRARGRRPIVVGGTGLYLKALVMGFEPPPTDPALRTELERLSDEELLAELTAADPATARREATNRRRLIRALEVVRLTGQPMAARRIGAAFPSVVLGVAVTRPELYRRIDQRLSERLQAGMIDEVAGLMWAGVSVEWLTSLGLEYRIITNWLTRQPEKMTLTPLHLSSVSGEVVQLEVRLRGAIHAYARRQLTYLRHQLPVRWVRNLAEALAVINEKTARGGWVGEVRRGRT